MGILEGFTKERITALCLLIGGLSAFWPLSSVAQQDSADYDLVVVGATPAGIAAAINAARYDHTVLLAEEYAQVGGLMTAGLSFTDFISYEVLGGTFLDYTQRVEAYYAEKYGTGSEQHQASHGGIHAEPHVTLAIFRQMLGEYDQITTRTNLRLTDVAYQTGADSAKLIHSVSLTDTQTGDTLAVRGRVFVDATYEGDLAARAGADYWVGRESREEYGEFLAGKIFYRYGVILPGSNGTADQKIQAYNFRPIMTDDPANRTLVPKPPGYRREDYVGIAQVLREGKVSQVFVEKGNDGLFRTQMLPNRKADVNDIKSAPVRMALLGENYAYPEGDTETRRVIVERHRNHLLGMLYFVQNDAAVPEKFRAEARQWGLAKDEFGDTDHFPPRLYIREARRIRGHYVFTQNDIRTIDNTLITQPKDDAIAIGDYALNCHGVAPATLHPDVADGDFNYIPAPFQIPLGVIVPRGFDNLLVPVAVSASHVGFSGLRLESTWTALGQAAGIAAHVTIQTGTSVPEVPVRVVQKLLHQHGAKTTYISDVDADSPYFAAAQWLGLWGFMHDLYAMDSLEMRGAQTYKSLRGTQYAQAYPFHALQPERPAPPELAETWAERIKGDAARESILTYYREVQPTVGELLLMIADLEEFKVP
ncbi:MAG: FAD-dependent oxidoreductase [Tunicatimonas sp.]